MEELKDLDKKSNMELESLKKELRDRFEKVRFDVVKIYDYWQSIGYDYEKVNKELKQRGLL
jgi:hypothetical protein